MRDPAERLGVARDEVPPPASARPPRIVIIGAASRRGSRRRAAPRNSNLLPRSIECRASWRWPQYGITCCRRRLQRAALWVEGAGSPDSVGP